MSEQIKNKIVNPEAHFDEPKHVVQDDALSHQEKPEFSIPGSRMNDRCRRPATKGCPGAMRANERRRPIVSTKLFKRKIRSSKSQRTSPLIKRA